MWAIGVDMGWCYSITTVVCCRIDNDSEVYLGIVMGNTGWCGIYLMWAIGVGSITTVCCWIDSDWAVGVVGAIR